MYERLKSFLEKNKELIKENRWSVLYQNAWSADIHWKLANFLYEGLGQETLLDLFDKEGKIPTCAFIGCRKLKSITIPSSVTSIGDSAFYGCSSLTSITFKEPSRMTSIGNCAFQGCKILTNITIPDSVNSIGWAAFAGCSKLPSITIPDSVTSIGSYAFHGCTCHIIFECDKSIVTKDALRDFKGTYEFI